MDETQGIVPARDIVAARKTPRPARPWFELLLCVLGSICTTTLPVIGILAMVFGAWLLSRKEEGRAWWAVAGCLVPGIALSFVSWDLGSLVLPYVACALVIALALPGRVTITNVCATIVATFILMVAADASLVMLWGESFAAYVSALLDEVRELTVASLGGTSTPAIQAGVDQTLELLGKVWPLMYVSRAAIAVIVGLLGLMLARRDTYQSVYVAFTRFDMPLWGVVALIAAIACMVGPTMGVPYADTFEAIGLNVLFCLRVLFFIQGLAMAMCLMDRHGWGPIPRMLALAAMLMAELGLYAVCVFGVIDVWANFRHLERSRAPRTAGSRGEGE